MCTGKTCAPTRPTAPSDLRRNRSHSAGKHTGSHQQPTGRPGAAIPPAVDHPTTFPVRSQPEAHGCSRCRTTPIQRTITASAAAVGAIEQRLHKHKAGSQPPKMHTPSAPKCVPHRRTGAWRWQNSGDRHRQVRRSGRRGQTNQMGKPNPRPAAASEGSLRFARRRTSGNHGHDFRQSVMIPSHRPPFAVTREPSPPRINPALHARLGTRMRLLVPALESIETTHVNKELERRASYCSQTLRMN
jgi:hypothetical protein